MQTYKLLKVKLLFELNFKSSTKFKVFNIENYLPFQG